MRILSALIVGVLALGPGAAAKPARTQMGVDYGSSDSIALCVIAGCQIFRGTVVAEPQQSGRPGTVRVDEWTFGKPKVPPDAVAVPCEDWEHPHPGMSDGRLSAAWSGVRIADGVAVTVVLAVGDGPAGRRGDPVRVTSDGRESAVIRSVAEAAERLEADPALESELVGSLSGSPDPALAGYLVTHLWMHAPTPPQPALATELLLQILEGPSVPGDMMEFVAGVVVFHYSGLPAAVKSDVARRFVDLGQRQDVQCARAGTPGWPRSRLSIARLLARSLRRHLGRSVTPTAKWSRRAASGATSRWRLR
jgi:hypothetical protein